ncbi:MAG: NADH-quinone oxidoreductase subunit NuoE family protein [Armatimonadota bacterium]
MSEHTCDCEVKVKQAAEEEAANYVKLDEIINSFKGQRGVLIQALHQAQEVFGWLPEKVQIKVAEGLDIPVSEVHGVATFYSFFNTVPKGEQTVRVCLGTACYVRGGKQILEQFSKELSTEIGGTTPDRKFSLEINRCVGACGLAPVVTVGADIYRRVKLDKIPGIIAKYKG